MAAWDITTKNTRLTLNNNAVAHYPHGNLMDANHAITIWAGSGTDGYVQIVTINTSTWAVTTANSALEFDTTIYGAGGGEVYKIDSTHAIALYPGSGSDGYIDSFAINTTTWAVSTAASRLEFDTTNATSSNSCMMDANHVFKVWQGSAGDGFAQVMQVDTTTWAVTTSNARLEFDTQNLYASAAVKIDDTHALVSWVGGATSTSRYAQVFAINTTTWEVSTAAAVFTVDTQVTSGSNKSRLEKIDDNHVILGYSSGSAGNTGSYLQVLTINTSTWVVSTSSERFTAFSSTTAQSMQGMAQIDATHYIFTTYHNTATDHHVAVFAVNTSTWAVSTASSNVLAYDTSATAQETHVIKIDTTHYLALYNGTTIYLYAEVWEVSIPTTYTQDNVAKAFIGATSVTASSSVIAHIREPIELYPSSEIGISDDFNDNTLAAIWTKEGDTAQSIEQNSQLEITHNNTAQYNTTATTSSYNILGGHVDVVVANAGNQSLTSHEVIFGLRADSNNAIWFTITGGNISAYKKVATTTTQVGSSITYNATTHKHLRLKEFGGTTYWDTSSDGITWTNRWSIANPITLTSVSFYMQSGAWQVEASGSYGYFENFIFVATTTAQLTAPSGKSAGSDFEPGLITDLANPIGEIDLGADKYTELEWNIRANDQVKQGYIYEFRVTDAGTVIDSYARIAEWTILPEIKPNNTKASALALRKNYTEGGWSLIIYGGTNEASDVKYASSIVSETQFTLQVITTEISYTGTVTDDLVFKITDSLGGSALATATITKAYVDSLGSAYKKVVFDSPVEIYPTQTYYIEISRSGSRDTNNYWNLLVTDFSEEHPQDTLYGYNSGAWEYVSDYELKARIYVSATGPALAKQNQVKAFISPANTAENTYYFDNSGGDLADINDRWSNDANAFDADPDTKATYSNGGDGNGLSATGTNAPASGDTIHSVFFWWKGDNTYVVDTFYANVIHDAETLTTSSVYLPIGTVGGYSALIELDVPTGGWDWTKLGDLKVEFGNLSSASNYHSAYIAEIVVFTIQAGSTTKNNSVKANIYTTNAKTNSTKAYINQKAGYLIDDFNDESIDTANKWEIIYNGVEEINDWIEIDFTTDEENRGLMSRHVYDLTNSSITIHLVSSAINSDEFYLYFGAGVFQDYPDVFNTNRFSFNIGENKIRAGWYVDGGGSNYSAIVDFLPSQHRFFKIGESGGSVYFETSINGIDWTSFRSSIDSFPIDITHIRPYFMGYQVTGTARTSIFDSFNIIETFRAQQVSTKSHIVVASTKDQQVIANILVTHAESQSVLACIQTTNTSSNEVIAEIYIPTQTYSEDNQVVANIKTTVSNQNMVKSWILVKQSSNQDVIGCIQITNSFNNASKATIQVSHAESSAVLANINKTTTKDTAVIGCIQTTGQEQNLVIANIIRYGELWNNTSKATIQVSHAYGHYGVACIQKVENNTNSVIANISATDSRENLVLGNISAPQFKSNLAIANLVGSTSSDSLVIANINRFQAKDNLVIVAITNFNQEPNSVLGNILRIESFNNSVVATIQTTSSYGQDVLANIQTTSALNNSVIACIQVSHENSHEVVANIVKLTSKENLVIGSIEAEGKQQNNVLANILRVGDSQENSTKANIVIEYAEDNSVGANIQVTTLNNNFSLANIETSNSYDNQVIATIEVEHTTSQDVIATIVNTKALNNLVLANIETSHQFDNSVKATIQVAHTNNNFVVANIIAIQTKNNLVIGSIESEGQQANYVVANIIRTELVSNTVKANIYQTHSENNYALAYIYLIQLWGNEAVANIQTTTTPNNQVIANITTTNSNNNQTIANIIRYGESHQNLVIANLYRTETSISQVLGNIETTSSSSQDVIANIIAIQVKSNSVLASIESEGKQANSVVANILKSQVVENYVIGNISQTRIEPNLVIAYIYLIQSQAQEVKANIQVTNTNENLVRATVVVANTLLNQVVANILRTGEVSNNTVLANIVRAETNNNQALATIETSVSRNNLVLANIIATQTKDNLVIALIESEGQQQNATIANILRIGESWTNDVIGKIFHTYTNNHAVKAVIEASYQLDQATKATIETRITSQNLVIANIETENTNANTAVANILGITQLVNLVKATIQVQQTQNQVVIANILRIGDVVANYTMACIVRHELASQEVIARISVTHDSNQEVKANIIGIQVKSNLVRATIDAEGSWQVAVLGNILKAFTNNNGAIARIEVGHGNNQLVKAHIQVSHQLDQIVKANIQHTIATEQSALANIEVEGVNSQQAKADILVTQNQNNSIIGNILVSNIADHYVKATIESAHQLDNLVKSHILTTVSQDQKVRAYIGSASTANNLTIANIIGYVNWPQDVRAIITKAGNANDNSVIASIILGGADIYKPKGFYAQPFLRRRMIYTPRV